MSNEQVWVGWMVCVRLLTSKDDSMLVRAWDDAVQEYKV